jgi:spore maturation protein CgeB
MRILRVCPTPVHTQQIYKQYKKPRKFQEAIHLLRETNVLLPGGWKDEMEALGHEVFETSFDDHFLQGRWAFEYGALSAFSSHSPSTALLAKQIEHFKPDVVFLFAGVMYRLDNKERQYLRSICEHKFKCVGFWGDEVPHNTSVYEYFGDLDFLFASNEAYKDYFQQNGVQSAVLGASFDEKFATPDVYHPNPDLKTPLFVGDTGYLAPDHIKRYETLDQLLERTNLKIFGFQRNSVLSTNGRLGIVLQTAQRFIPDIVVRKAMGVCYRYFPGRRRIIKALGLIRTANTIGISVLALLPQAHPFAPYFLNKLSLRKKYPGRVNPGPLGYKEYLNLLSAYMLNINIHRDEENDYGNIRCFEVTGMGSLLFSDRIEKMNEFFVYGEEYVGFRDAEDLITKINYYRQHPEEAQRIAEAGKRRTLAQYTLKQRCKMLHEKFISLSEAKKNPRKRTLVANYDLSRYPISYDFAFFLECALIKKRQSYFQSLHVNLIMPRDIGNIAGVSTASDKAVDQFGRSFRINHVCAQIASVFPVDSFSMVQKAPELDTHTESPLYNDYPHHADFYAYVNQQSAHVKGFSASAQAKRYAKQYLQSLSNGPYCTINLRCYEFDTQRNSNLPEWQKVADDLTARGVTVIVIPDTDQFGKDPGLPVPESQVFWPGCFDVDLRYALYELCDFNFFVNNGPATMASLNKNIKLATFKFVVPGVPHCTVEFIERQGYKYSQNPAYATQYQHWQWVDDTYANIKPVIDHYFGEIHDSTFQKRAAAGKK